VLVQEHDRVADQVDRRLEPGTQHEEPDPVQLHPRQVGGLRVLEHLAQQVVTGVAAQPVEVVVEPGVHLAERSGGGAVLRPAEPRIEGDGRMVAPAEDLTALVRRDAEQVGDHRDRELRGVSAHQVEGGLLLEVVEQPVGDRLDAVGHPADLPGGERPRDQAPVAGVDRRVDDEHRRRVDRAQRVLVAQPGVQLLQGRGQLTERAAGELVAAEDGVGDGVVDRPGDEPVAHDAAAGAEAFVRRVRIVVVGGVGGEPRHQVALAGRATQEAALQPVRE
jgi:hypothetical protein